MRCVRTYVSWCSANFVAFFVLNLAGWARAEPLVRVRAESRIELGVVHQASAIAVSGALRDELGAPLSERLLAIEALSLDGSSDPWRSQLTTDRSGRFSIELADSKSDYRLLATFAGDATHRGVRVERKIERAKADVRLELRLPSEGSLDLDSANLFVEALAESDAGGDAIALQLTDETGHIIARGITSPEGRLSLHIQPDSHLQPGPGLLRLESARDERRAEAQTEARIVRRRAVTITLEADGQRFEAGDPLLVRGTARTRVSPRSKVPVGLFFGHRHLETVVTEEDGTFQTTLWFDATPGQLLLKARAEADPTGAYPSAEAELRLEIVPHTPVPLHWVFAAGGIIALLLLVAARLRKPVNPEPSRDPSLDARPGTSILPSPRRGRRDRMHVQGRSASARSNRPIANAEIRIEHELPEGCCSLLSNEQGHFSSPNLPPGRARLWVSAQGFAAAQVNLELPHRGEWTSFEIRLESQRDRALSPFRRLAMRVLPSARVWGIWTNREARTWLTQNAPEQKEQLRQLTLEVEQACYGPTPPSETDVLAIEQASSAIEANLPGARTPD